MSQRQSKTVVVLTIFAGFAHKRKIASLREWKKVHLPGESTAGTHEKRPGRAGLLAVVFAGLVLAPTALHAEPVQFRDLAAQCAPWVHPTTLSAVVMQESRANPLAIGVNGSFKLKRQPRDKAEAVATARWLKENGHNFDAGLGQINVNNMGWLGLDFADLFDPCANLRGAGLVLSDCYTRASRNYGAGQKALMAALSCYNTGDFGRGLRNGYVGKVASRAGVQVPALTAPSTAQTKPAIVDQPPAATLPRERSKDVFADELDGADELPRASKVLDLQESVSDPAG